MAIKITLPTIEMGKEINSFTLNRKKARVRNLPSDWRCVFKLSYPDEGIDIGMWNSEIEWDINKFSTNEFILQNNLWHPNNVITLYFLNNNQETAAAVSYEIIVTDIATELELYHYNIPYLSPKNSLEFNIYPTEESGQAKIKINTISETDITSYFQIRIQQQHYNVVEWSTDDYDIIKEEVSYNNKFQTINQVGQAKFTIEAILYNKEGKAVNTEQELLDENEVSAISNFYLEYKPPLDNASGVGIISSIISTNEQRIVKQQPIIQIPNKSQITIDWSNIVPTSNFTQPYWYLLKPKRLYTKYPTSIAMSEQMDLNANAHLQNYHIIDPIEVYEYNKYGKLTKMNRLSGYPIANYVYDNNIAYGLPLPSIIFNKSNSNIQTWSGLIASYFASGKGTETDPYIISTPEELARAILKDYETRFEAWKRRKGYNLLEEKEEWRDQYFNAEIGEWQDDTNQIYYKVNENCYAFNMNGSSNITLQTTRNDMRQSGYSNFVSGTFKNKWVINNFYYPAYSFSGVIDGNGLIVYNLNGYAPSDYSAGFIPVVMGNVQIRNFIIKNSHFSNTHFSDPVIKPIENALGGFVGSHCNYAPTGQQSKILIENCMIINSQIIYRGTSGLAVAAAFIGNGRYSKIIVNNCCAYFNEIDTNGSMPAEYMCSIGGFIGCFQNTAAPNEIITNLPLCNNCGMIGDQLVPKGQLYSMDEAHWGWKKLYDANGQAWFCDEFGIKLPSWSDGTLAPGVEPVHLNPQSECYHFYSGLNSYPSSIENNYTNWTDRILEYTHLPFYQLPYPSNTTWWTKNWSEELWQQYKEIENRIITRIDWCWGQLKEGNNLQNSDIGSSLGTLERETFEDYFYEIKTAKIIVNGQEKILEYAYWLDDYGYSPNRFQLYRGQPQNYHPDFINKDGYKTISFDASAFDIDNLDFEHNVNSPTSTSTRADVILRNVKNIYWSHTNFQGHDAPSQIAIILTRFDQEELRNKYNNIYKTCQQHWNENIEKYTNKTEEEGGVLLPDGTIRVQTPGKWYSPTDIIYRHVRLPWQITYFTPNGEATGSDSQVNSFYRIEQQINIITINDLLIRQDIPYFNNNTIYYRPKLISSNLKPENQKFIFDLSTTIYTPRGNDVWFWLEVEPFYQDPTNLLLPYYGRNTRINSLGKEITLQAQSPWAEITPNPGVYVKSPYYNTYGLHKLYIKQENGSYKEGKVFVRQNWDEENQKYIYKEAF